MPRWTQVKRLTEPDVFRDHVASLGVELPLVNEVAPDGALAQPYTIQDGSLGGRRVANRWAVLPMEGWDGTTDGRPTDLVRRRWARFATSGAKPRLGRSHCRRARGSGQSQPAGDRRRHGG